jgi:hypothetical protein
MPAPPSACPIAIVPVAAVPKVSVLTVPLFVIAPVKLAAVVDEFPPQRMVVVLGEAPITFKFCCPVMWRVVDITYLPAGNHRLGALAPIAVKHA